MPRSHDKECFFKYTSFEAALKILENGCLLWSAPESFNDPFDVNVNYVFQFNENDLAQKINEVKREIIFGEEDPNFVKNTDLAITFNKLRNQRKQGLLRPEAEQELDKISRNVAEKFETFKENLNDTLRRHLAQSRILCLSETNDNVVMWSHYGQNHQGVVLQLNCVDSIDDNLLAARRVEYLRDFPKFYDLDTWVRGFFGLTETDYSRLADKMPFYKHEDWAYEKEWRVYVPITRQEEEKEDSSLYKKNDSVFGGLYLGCRMNSYNQGELIELANENYPEMPVFIARLSDESYSIEFEPVS